MYFNKDVISMSEIIPQTNDQNLKTTSYIDRLLEVGVSIRLDGDQLRINIPKDGIDAGIKDELVARKEELRAYLKEDAHLEQQNRIPRSLIPRPPNPPMSYSQERFWFLENFSPEKSTHVITSILRLIGPLDNAAIEKSLQEIIRRHEPLRTNFVLHDNKPVQKVQNDVEFRLNIVDLTALPEEKQEEGIKNYILQQLNLPFDLTRDLMLRAQLLKLQEKEHILFVGLHHIASDGWSVGLFWNEFSVLYTSYVKGEEALLPELPLNYVDYAVWQRNWLEGFKQKKKLAFWRKQLADLAIQDLPTDRPRPPVLTNSGDYLEFQLSIDLLTKLRELSKRERVTLFMVLLAAFSLLLKRYSRQDDIAVGTVVANRSIPDTEKMVGLFINNLVMRTDLSGNPTFLELLERIRNVALDAYDNQDIPFEMLLEELQPERDMSRTPYFQTMLILQNLPGGESLLPNIETRPVDLMRESSDLDILLYLYESGEGLFGKFEFRADLFDKSTIQRMANNLETLLRGIVVNPERRISDLPLLTEKEKQLLLIDWNDTKAEYPRDKCIHQLIQSQAMQSPDAVAVIFGDDQLTYKELNERSNQLARYLQGLGVGPDVFVGIYMERSLEMMIGLLGILKAGGAYLPLDPSFPRERLAYMLEDSQARVLLTQKWLVNEAPKHQAQLVCLDDDWPNIVQQSRENLSGEVTSENLAYAIYTSGSTGRPKGVQIEHRTLVNFLESMSRKPGFTAEDVLLAVTTLSFDIAGLELFLPLMVGARIVLASSADAADGFRILELLDRSEVTVMQATPATWWLLLASGWPKTNSLKILCGGEAMPRDLADQLLKYSDSVWNLYGPTETTVWSTVKKVELGEGQVSIGKPIANTQIYILDVHLQPVPIGALGELYIGGDGLSRGYLKRPELNAEKFIPNPFSDQSDARLYRTGDLARYLPNGDIEFYGRIDHQVKVRGYRIELGEIEHVLNEHPDVNQTVVIVREDEPQDQRIVAYYVAKPDRQPLLDDLRHHLRASLPDYMIPTAFVLLDTFPLLPNGKIDRRSLPVPDRSHQNITESYVPPRTSVERTITSVWEDVLRIDQIGIHDDFFELGGHSLLVMQVISRINEELDIELPMRTLFEETTVEDLAQKITMFRDQRISHDEDDHEEFVL